MNCLAPSHGACFPQGTLVEVYFCYLASSEVLPVSPLALGVYPEIVVWPTRKKYTSQIWQHPPPQPQCHNFCVLPWRRGGPYSPPEQDHPASGGQGRGSLASYKMGSSVLPGKIFFGSELFWFTSVEGVVGTIFWVIIVFPLSGLTGDEAVALGPTGWKGLFLATQ